MGTFPGKEWSLDFTQILKSQGYRYLLVYVETLSGWMEAFATCMGKSQKVIKSLLKEIIQWFGL
jgi:hypothetical protein